MICSSAHNYYICLVFYFVSLSRFRSLYFASLSLLSWRIVNEFLFYFQSYTLTPFIDWVFVLLLIYRCLFLFCFLSLISIILLRDKVICCWSFIYILLWKKERFSFQISLTNLMFFQLLCFSSSSLCVCYKSNKWLSLKLVFFQVKEW